MNVLLVTYSFPPVGGVGVLRAASLARYFPEHDIRLDVLTTRNPSAVGMDSELLDRIPKSVTIHRTFTLDIPFALKKWIKERITGARGKRPTTSANTSPSRPGMFRRIAQDILLPDPQVTWLPIVARAATRIIKQRNIDLVLITVPPFSSVKLAPRLRARFPNLDIVLDFRDEWLSTSIDLISFSSSPRARRIAHKVEADAVASATAVVAVTEPARQLLRSRYPGQPEGKFLLVPNGFDATQLPEHEASSPGNRSGSVVLTYLGTLYASTQPATLIQAIHTLPSDVRSRLRVRFIGRIEDPGFRQSLAELGETIEMRGFMPQAQALQALQESDYALLITHDPVNVSAKFYDYLGVGKPIVATVHPDGAVRHLLEDLRAGWWASSRDVESVRDLLTYVVTHRDEIMEKFRPDREKISSFRRETLAAKYVQELRGLHPIVGSETHAVEYAKELKAEKALR